VVPPLVFLVTFDLPVLSNIIVDDAIKKNIPCSMAISVLLGGYCRYIGGIWN